MDGLEHSSHLMELNLDKNQIKHFEPGSFLSLIHLKSLSLKENRLKSLSHLDSLPQLQRLYISNNRIHELYEIEVKTLFFYINLKCQ